jgi:hypothetical protein
MSKVRLADSFLTVHCFSPFVLIGRQDPVGRMLLGNTTQQVKITMLANGAAHRSALAALLGFPPPGRHATARAIVNTTEVLDGLEVPSLPSPKHIHSGTHSLPLSLIHINSYPLAHAGKRAHTRALSLSLSLSLTHTHTHTAAATADKCELF